MPASSPTLPVELSSFVGRERELTQLRDLLQSWRLVTLIGAGGSGKTRLAVELGSELEPQFRNGLAFVHLAPLSDPALIAQAIVQVLGLVESTRRTAEEALLGALRESEMLLVLDNCEHLVEECAALVERLLKGCPDMRVMATSRQPLEIAGEVTFAVPPLSLPPLETPPSVQELAAFEAVRLFADRTTAARPGFALEDSNLETVAHLCRRLDGLPLAIELAAARGRSLSPDEILERLDDRFSLLARGPRTSVPRHQTLRATIDWSHDLLTDGERTLFRRLSVFTGGWRLEDAEAVCVDELLLRDSMVDLHSRLIDRSLVVAEPGPAGPTRHRFLETIRQYADERLSEAGETEVLQVRHFEHFLAVAEGYYEERMAGGSDAGLSVVAAHRDNFRAALAWSVERNPEGTLRLTAALDDFWRMSSAAEGWQWLQRTLPLTARESPHRVRALLTAGMLSAYMPAYAEGAGLLSEVVSAARRSGDRVSEAWAELWLGRLAFFGDDAERAERHLERALAAHEDLGNALGQVRALALLGLLEGLVRGQLAEGQERLERAVAMAHDIGDSWGEGYAHLMLGLCAADADDLERAARHSRAALSASSLGPILGVPLQGMARVAVESDPSRAMRLLGGAAGHFERTGTLEPPFVRRRAEATRQRAEELLGPDAAATAFEAGRTMGTDEVVAYALVEPTASRRGPGGLTSREVQVAGLVARGETNRDIARTLHISVRTAESHIDHILTKVGLHNRTQLAAWARGNGLSGDRTDLRE